MKTFQTTDPKVARRCRFAQLRGEKTRLTLNGSPLMGMVHSVKEDKSSTPTRWSVTLIAQKKGAAA
jgi:hypothetical protein